MANKTNAPEGFYDAVLVDSEYVTKEDGSSILEMHFDVGADYFWVDVGVWLVNAPTGYAITDAERLERTKDNVERIKAAFPDAVIDGKLQLGLIFQPTEEIKSTKVRLNVWADEKGYVHGKLCKPKGGKPKMAKADALRMAIRDQRALAAMGIAVESASAEQHVKVTAGTPEAAALDIPF